MPTRRSTSKVFDRGELNDDERDQLKQQEEIE